MFIGCKKANTIQLIVSVERATEEIFFHDFLFVCLIFGTPRSFLNKSKVTLAKKNQTQYKN